MQVKESYKSSMKDEEIRTFRGSDSRIASFKGEDGIRLSLHKFTIRKGFEQKELAGVSARVESGSDLQSRITVTRLLAFGVFALALKKKKGGEKYVTIEGPDFVWIAEAGRQQIKDAYSFVASVNDAVTKYIPPEPSDNTTSETADVQPVESVLDTDQLVQLSQLHEQGALTDEEYASAKKKILGL